jgi:hypothetical protein
MCDHREQVLDYFYDEASPAGRREAERHIEDCDECRDEIRAFRSVREDLLAWGVPNPPSVWTAFAPAPVVPWHKQVPAWAMAAAASLMFVVGSAGGFLAHNLVDGRGPEQGTQSQALLAPADATKTAGLDAEAIMTLIKQELASADRGLTGRATLVNNTAARPVQLDARTEERLFSRVSDLVNARDQQRREEISLILMKRGQEDATINRDAIMKVNRLAAQVEQLQAQVSQLVIAQAKGQ